MRAIISIQKDLLISIMKLVTRNNMHMNANLFKFGPSSNDLIITNLLCLSNSKKFKQIELAIECNDLKGYMASQL